jgi:hypothetical protein
MKKLLTMIAVFAVMATTALADVTIAVGQTGRGYEAFGKNMAAVMADRVTATVQNYDGSDSISRAVCDGKADIGIMQIDAIYTRQTEGCKLSVVGIYGREYVYLMVPPNSDIGALSDLTADSTVMTDTLGSGTDLFWNTAVSIENGPDGNQSGWQKAKKLNAPIAFAESNIELGAADAVLIVAKNDSKDVKGLIDAGWEMASFYDKDLNDFVFNGDSLYPVEEASIAKTSGFFSGDVSNDSYVIRSFVAMNAVVAKDNALAAEVARAAKVAASMK